MSVEGKAEVALTRVEDEAGRAVLDQGDVNGETDSRLQAGTAT
jgi:hypothetical protein